MRTSRLSAAVLAMVATTTACSQKQEPSDQKPLIEDQPADKAGGAATPGAPAAGKKLFVYVSPDPLGVNPFLLMGKNGLETAAGKHGADVKVFESEDPTTRRDNLRAAVDAGATLVAVLGFQFNDVIVEFAGKHPEVDFLIVDQCVDTRPKNLHCAVFREHEPAFLLGPRRPRCPRKGRSGWWRPWTSRSCIASPTASPPAPGT